MINFQSSGLVGDGWTRPTDESVEDLEARGIVQRVKDEDVPEDQCSNPRCLDGYVDKANSSPDGSEYWVDQVRCQVCNADEDDDPNDFADRRRRTDADDDD